ncbi:MAG: hypothetical protein NVS9B15_08980 [Acidobacteriaceae bacterium]
MRRKNLKLLLTRKGRGKRAKEDPGLWINPNLSRLLKGSDHKLSSDEAERYWMDRHSRRPSADD